MSVYTDWSNVVAIQSRHLMMPLLVTVATPSQVYKVDTQQSSTPSQD